MQFDFRSVTGMVTWDKLISSNVGQWQRTVRASGNQSYQELNGSNFLNCSADQCFSMAYIY